MSFWSNLNDKLITTATSANKNIEYSVLKQSDNSSKKNLEYCSGESDNDEDDDNLELSRNRHGAGSIQLKMGKQGSYDMREAFDKSYEELVYSKQKIRNIRIIVLVLTILLVGCLIAVLVVLLANATQPELMEKNEQILQLNDILHGTLRAKSFNGTWTAANMITYRQDKKIIEFDLKTQRKQTTFELNGDYEYATQQEKSADGKFLLIARDPIKQYRHSFSSRYDVMNLSDSTITPIQINHQHVRLMLAKWSPVGNALILHYHSNLYYKPTALDEPIQLTEDTDPRILNGIPDWVYEEEVFSSNEAVWFNPSGTKIAYVQFDDTPTHPMSIPVYGEAGSIDFQYPLHKTVPYPKAGSPNPFVKVFQIDLEKVKSGIAEIYPIPVPGTLNTDDHIITAVTWLTKDSVLTVWMNRIQNEANIQVTDKKRFIMYRITSSTGWVDLFKPPIKNQNGKQVALILPTLQGSESVGYYRHLVILPVQENSKPIVLTDGTYIVQSILNWDYDTNMIFYMANMPDKSQVLHLFAIKANKGEKPQCITCSIKDNGVPQTYFSVDFSMNGKYMVISSLGPNTPRIGIYKWSINSGNINLEKLFDWETNDQVRKLAESKALPTTEIHTIDIGNGFTAKVLLQLPPNLDRSGKKKYPLLVDVYGGPDSNSVVDTWGIDWGSYLASNRSIIYAKIDGRGSGLRGDKLLHSIYLNLGNAEVLDQIHVTQKLQDKLPFIDGNHVGIWGWSYGGYASGMALAKDENNVFRCAASVAPVTDWLYYDSIYTERYMQTPDKNPTGYIESRLSTMAENFRGKRYLLIHGTLDDNVHYQQAMILAKNLERFDIPFKQISYADEDHSLGNVRPHLYHALDKFFGECFGIEKSRFF